MQLANRFVCFIASLHRSASSYYPLYVNGASHLFFLITSQILLRLATWAICLEAAVYFAVMPLSVLGQNLLGLEQSPEDLNNSLDLLNAEPNPYTQASLLSPPPFPPTHREQLLYCRKEEEEEETDCGVDAAWLERGIIEHCIELSVPNTQASIFHSLRASLCTRGIVLKRIF